MRGDELQYHCSASTHLRVAVVQHLVQQLVDQYKVALQMVEGEAGRWGDCEPLSACQAIRVAHTAGSWLPPWLDLDCPP